MTDNRIRTSPLILTGLPRHWFGCTKAAQEAVAGIDALSALAWDNGHHALSRLLDSALRQWPIRQLVSYAGELELPDGVIPLAELEAQMWVILQDLLRAIIGHRPKRNTHLRWFVTDDHTTRGWLKLITWAVEAAMEEKRTTFRELHVTGPERRLLRENHPSFAIGRAAWLEWDSLLSNATPGSWHGVHFTDGDLLLVPSSTGMLTEPGKILTEVRLVGGQLMTLNLTLPGDALAVASAMLTGLRARIGRLDDDGHTEHLHDQFVHRLAFTLTTRSAGATDPSRVHRDTLGNLDGLLLGKPRLLGEPLREGMIVGLRGDGPASEREIGVIEHDGVQPDTFVVRIPGSDGDCRVVPADDLLELRQPPLVSAEPQLV